MVETDGKQTFVERVNEVAVAAGLVCQTQSAQHVVVAFDVGDGRRQLVHLTEAGELYGTTAVNVVSFAAELTEPLPPEDAGRLLSENGNHKIGYWAVYETQQTRLLGIGHNVLLEGLAPDAFRVLVTTLALEADLRERNLSEEDRF